MTDEEALLTIGQMVVDARDAEGWTRAVAAERIGLNYRTLQDVERGRRLPNKTTLAGIEKAYGWSSGALLRLWEDRKNLEFGSAHISDLRLHPSEIPVPLVKAQDLSTEELLAELSFRVLVLSRTAQREDNP